MGKMGKSYAIKHCEDFIAPQFPCFPPDYGAAGTSTNASSLYGPTSVAFFALIL